jgi:uncharacterized protein YabN with tetrapyrrole methylase and pyrophosphatase domain
MSAAAEFPFDIAVVGLGITGVHHITREAGETLRRCRRTFAADSTPGVLAYLRTVSPDVADLSGHFTPAVHRASSYQAIASDVVAAAVEEAPVCFATYGHPKMYSYPTVLIQRAAAILDLRVRLLPGISFLDTLLADLGIDPGFDGLQLYEATDLLVRRRPLQPDVACVIAQAPTVLSPVAGQPADALANLARLQDYLLGFYPAEHDVVIVTSRVHPLLAPLLQRTRIGLLANALARASQSGTLYIPPVGRRPVADQELADIMRRASDE